MQKHRISTNLGIDQKITVELKQDFDVLEILSLKFSQQEIYTSICSDYGVVCGRVTANNGFGLGNARVSIFIPLSTEDENDPVISKLYPYKEVTDKDDNNYRYNLLPSRQQHGGHAATGTFPDQSDILSREEVLEVYEKYYKFTVKTNPAGDFMIWGVPVGNQTIHVDVDLSDIGCFSLRPYDLQRLGIGVDGFKNKYSFKSSEDLDSLPQIVSFDKLIEVYPFWGNEELCEIGITRTDFDLSDRGVNIKPTAYLIGGVYTDNGKNAINKNCTPRKKMGRKCDLVAKSANIEAIRFLPIKDDLNRPYLEYLPIDEDVPDDGGFVLPLEMNMDYIITNEFGENEYTNDFNKGIATSACYRFRFNLNDKGVERARNNADYLVPNIREFQTSGGTIDDSSYYFGTEWSGYPQNAVSINSNYGILYNEDGQFNPRDYFYRFTYNKVYTVSSLQSSYVNGTTFGKDQFIGLKELVPSEEEDCSDNLTPPVNFGLKNYTFTLLLADFLMSLDYIIKWVVLQFLNFIVKDVLGPLAEKLIDYGAKTPGRNLRRSTSLLQINNTTKLSLINYPECEECSSEDLVVGGGGDTTPLVNCKVAEITLTGITDNAYDRIITLGNSINNITGFTDNAYCVSQGATSVNDFSELTADQNLYVLEYGGGVMFLDPNIGGSYIYEESGVYKLNDRDFLFNQNIEYLVSVRKIGVFQTNPTSTTQLESGCDIYDTLYDETLATGYFVTSGNTRTYKPTLSAGDDVQSTLIAGEGTAVPGSGTIGPPGNGLAQCRDMEGEVHYLFTATPSYRSEFANGVFYIVPGTQSSARLTNVLKEYYRRKRVGKMFCGGIVNYSFIDNWLSGSLYFFQFKAKKVSKGVEGLIKYCRDVVRFVNTQQRFYYRSAYTTNGTTFSRLNNKTLGRPTTIVDLGPRDEFIKEICIDKNLDPNCSVARSIGPTSFKSFGELMGLAINYRMDISNATFGLDNFFDNAGFTGQSFSNVFDGDLLQLISINNEAGIEEFDLQSPKYLGYSYQFLDPELYPNVFKKDGYWGPLPVTFELDEDGERVRLCLNEPGRLTESSQKVPFYLWNKKGTGFGGTSEATSDDQSWDYNSIQLQPLQGMTYGYKFTGGTNDVSDQYLLLPMTNNFTGLTLTSIGVNNEIEFDVIIPSGLTHSPMYDSEYPGFTVLKSSSNEVVNPTSGTLYTRYGTAGTWQTISWNTNVDFILPRREDYYDGTKQILSTPYQFYFGLKAGKTGLDKFIDLFGPKGAFNLLECEIAPIISAPTPTPTVTPTPTATPTVTPTPTPTLNPNGLNLMSGVKSGVTLNLLCSGGGSSVNIYFSGTSIQLGEKLYSNNTLPNPTPVINGRYYYPTYETIYVVTGGLGSVTSTEFCPTPTPLEYTIENIWTSDALTNNPTEQDLTFATQDACNGTSNINSSSGLNGTATMTGWGNNICNALRVYNIPSLILSEVTGTGKIILKQTINNFDGLGGNKNWYRQYQRQLIQDSEGRYYFLPVGGCSECGVENPDPDPAPLVTATIYAKQGVPYDAEENNIQLIYSKSTDTTNIAAGPILKNTTEVGTYVTAISIEAGTNLNLGAFLRIKSDGTCDYTNLSLVNVFADGTFSNTRFTDTTGTLFSEANAAGTQGTLLGATFSISQNVDIYITTNGVPLGFMGTPPLTCLISNE